MPAHSVFVPQFGQNLAVGGTTWLQFGHVFTFGVAGVVVNASPQFGQNFEVTGAVALHFGHNTSVCGGAVPVPNIGGISIMPAPRAAPGDFPSSSAAFFTVSILRTSAAGTAPPDLSQNSLSL